MKLSFIAFPGTPFTSAHHYAVFLRGDAPLTSRLLKPALIDAETGALTDMRELPWYVSTLLLSQPLHFGDYGGMPLKIIWAALDAVTIVVLASGLFLWVGRRRTAESALGGIDLADAAAPTAAAARRMKRTDDTGGGRLLQIFAWPLLLGVLSGAGLILALIGDGAWDAASWLLLATPLVAIVWGLARSAPRGG